MRLLSLYPEAFPTDSKWFLRHRHRQIELGDDSLYFQLNAASFWGIRKVWRVAISSGVRRTIWAVWACWILFLIISGRFP